jgi:hypothetical protein
VNTLLLGTGYSIILQYNWFFTNLSITQPSPIQLGTRYSTMPIILLAIGYKPGSKLIAWSLKLEVEQFSDSTDLTWTSWKLDILSKLEVNTDHFRTERPGKPISWTTRPVTQGGTWPLSLHQDHGTGPCTPSIRCFAPPRTQPTRSVFRMWPAWSRGPWLPAKDTSRTFHWLWTSPFNRCHCRMQMLVGFIIVGVR